MTDSEEDIVWSREWARSRGAYVASVVRRLRTGNLRHYFPALPEPRTDEAFAELIRHRKRQPCTWVPKAAAVLTGETKWD